MTIIETKNEHYQIKNKSLPAVSVDSFHFPAGKTSIDQHDFHANLCWLVLVWCWFSWWTSMMKLVHQQGPNNYAGLLS